MDAQKNLTALIIDDHALIGEGMREILRYGFDMFAYIATTGKEGLDFLENHPVHLVLLDIRLPDADGLEILEIIRKNHATLPVLIVSSIADKHTVQHALKVGATGFSPKTESAENFDYAVRMVLSGQSYLPESLQTILNAKPSQNSTLLPHDRLSKQEFTVFLLLVQGLGVHSIAEQMGCSVSSVNTYRRRILEKMEMTATYELIRYASEHNLLP